MLHKKNKKFSSASFIFFKGKKNFFTKHFLPCFLIAPRTQPPINGICLQNPDSGRRTVFLFLFLFIFCIGASLFICLPQAFKPFLIVLRVNRNQFLPVSILYKIFIRRRSNPEYLKSLFHFHKPVLRICFSKGYSATIRLNTSTAATAKITSVTACA